MCWPVPVISAPSDAEVRGLLESMNRHSPGNSKNQSHINKTTTLLRLKEKGRVGENVRLKEDLFQCICLEGKECREAEEETSRESVGCAVPTQGQLAVTATVRIVTFMDLLYIPNHWLVLLNFREPLLKLHLNVMGEFKDAYVL